MKTVCFLGDSITRRGYWIAEVFEVLKKDGIRLYNCGVSGDSATAAISRLYTDCLSRTPDTVVMMFGMNDVGRTLYDEGAGENREKREARLQRYRESIRTLSDMIRAAGIDLILCTPTPYNDVTPSTLPKSTVNEGLSACAEFIRAYAAEISVPCVDFFAALRPMVGKEYQTLPDLVHPTPESHHPMAQIFLTSLGITDAFDPTPFLPMCEEAQARFDVEQKLREIYFIEWNLMYGERMRRPMTYADFVALAQTRLEAATAAGDARQISWYSNYLRLVDHRLSYEEELVRRTLNMK
jgi:lysophospholipase L1-like esterase